METFADLIALWPSGTLAEDLGLKSGLPSVWKHRGTIPPEYWPEIVDSARKRGIAGVECEVLAAIAARKRRPKKGGRK